MATWRSKHRDPAFFFDIHDQRVRAQVWRVDGRTVQTRVPIAPAVGDSLVLRWSGPGQITVQATVTRITDPAPDALMGMSFCLQGIVSRESAGALKAFVQGALGLAIEQPLENKGSLWSLLFEAQSETGSKESFASLLPPTEPSTGPPVAVVGTNRDEEAPPPLVTGYEPTTLTRLGEWFAGQSDSKVAAYLNIPCAYVVAGGRYWGRALRINERWLNVNTSTAVPGLGVRLRCDLSLEIDGLKRPVSISGTVGRKLDPPAGSSYTGAMVVRIRIIDEGDSPGLLIYFLEHLARIKSESQT